MSYNTTIDSADVSVIGSVHFDKNKIEGIMLHSKSAQKVSFCFTNLTLYPHRISCTEPNPTNVISSVLQTAVDNQTVWIVERQTGSTSFNIKRCSLQAAIPPTSSCESMLQSQTDNKSVIMIANAADDFNTIAMYDSLKSELSYYAVERGSLTFKYSFKIGSTSSLPASSLLISQSTFIICIQKSKECIYGSTSSLYPNIKSTSNRYIFMMRSGKTFATLNTPTSGNFSLTLQSPMHIFELPTPATSTVSFDTASVVVQTGIEIPSSLSAVEAIEGESLSIPVVGRVDDTTKFDILGESYSVTTGVTGEDKGTSLIRSDPFPNNPWRHVPDNYMNISQCEFADPSPFYLILGRYGSDITKLNLYLGVKHSFGGLDELYPLDVSLPDGIPNIVWCGDASHPSQFTISADSPTGVVHKLYTLPLLSHVYTVPKALPPVSLAFLPFQQPVVQFTSNKNSTFTKIFPIHKSLTVTPVSKDTEKPLLKVDLLPTDTSTKKSVTAQGHITGVHLQSDSTLTKHVGILMPAIRLSTSDQSADQSPLEIFIGQSTVRIKNSAFDVILNLREIPVQANVISIDFGSTNTWIASVQVASGVAIYLIESSRNYFQTGFISGLGLHSLMRSSKDNSPCKLACAVGVFGDSMEVIAFPLRRLQSQSSSAQIGDSVAQIKLKAASQVSSISCSQEFKFGCSVVTVQGDIYTLETAESTEGWKSVSKISPLYTVRNHCIDPTSRQLLTWSIKSDTTQLDLWSSTGFLVQRTILEKSTVLCREKGVIVVNASKQTQLVTVQQWELSLGIPVTKAYESEISTTLLEFRSLTSSSYLTLPALVQQASTPADKPKDQSSLFSWLTILLIIIVVVLTIALVYLLKNHKLSEDAEVKNTGAPGADYHEITNNSASRL